MFDPDDPRVQDALTRAADELHLPDYYRSSVRPLVRNPEGRWPRCCGGGCEPCAQTLKRVAARTLGLLGSPRQAPYED